jgi:dihydrofolate reductase
MGRIIVTEFVSADGVMEAPGGEPGYKHSGWVGPMFSDEFGDFKYNEVVNADAHLLGRVTYEGFAGAWPHRDDPQGFAKRMNEMPKYVVTTTLTELEWNNSHIVEGDVLPALANLKDEVGDLLVAGSRTLVHTLYEHDLVDEYRLAVFPVILGSGRRLFPDDVADKRTLELVELAPYPHGVIVQTYHRA